MAPGWADLPNTGRSGGDIRSMGSISGSAGEEMWIKIKGVVGIISPIVIRTTVVHLSIMQIWEVG
jgi:hypothetical protein